MDEESLGLTGSRDIIGTPVYISPEQSIGKTIDARTDYYSLGVTLFEVFAGAPPLLGETAMETMILHQEMYPPLIRDINSEPIEAVPDTLEEIIARCLAKKPQDRYQSGQELYDELLAVKNELFPLPNRTHPGRQVGRQCPSKAPPLSKRKKRKRPGSWPPVPLLWLYLSLVSWHTLSSIQRAQATCLPPPPLPVLQHP
jgi:Serine/threonine protein kinase